MNDYERLSMMINDDDMVALLSSDDDEENPYLFSSKRNIEISTMTEKIEIKPVKTNKIIRKGQIFVIRKKEKNNDKFLVYRRNTHGLLGGLLAFPSQGWDDKEQNYNENWRPCNLNWTALKPKIKHVFSHPYSLTLFLSSSGSTVLISG